MQRLTPLIVALAVLSAACGSDDGDTAAPAVIIEGASAEPVTDGDAAPAGDESAAAAAATSAGDAADDTANDADGDGDTIADDEAQALAFAQCMRDEGLAFPDPTVGSDGSIQLIDPNNPPDIDANAPETEAALDVCGELIDGASFLPSDEDTAEIEDQLLQFADCLRDQGINVNDPDLSGGVNPGAIQEMFGDFDPQAPENAAVVATCQTEIAGIGGGN